MTLCTARAAWRAASNLQSRLSLVDVSRSLPTSSSLSALLLPSCPSVPLHRRPYSATALRLSPPSSPFNGNVSSTNNGTQRPAQQRRRKFVPRKAAISLTPKARSFFQSLLEGVATTTRDSPNEKPKKDSKDDDPIIGAQLTYTQSKTGEPRMVFGFSFLRASALHPSDEVVSLELAEDGESPKTPADAMDDGLPKLYVHRDAVLKVLGATLDVDTDGMMPILYGKEGNVMDPNA